MKPKLKIGLLLDGINIPFWVARTIERIDQSNYAEIDLLMLTEEAKKQLDSNQVKKSPLYEAFKYFDRGMNKSECDPLTLESLPVGLDNVSRIFLKRNDANQLAIPEDIALGLKERNLDALIDFCNVAPLGEISHYSRYGVLSFSVGDGERYKGDHVGLWEILDGTPITGSHIKRVRGNDVSIIYRSFSSTAMRSEKINREQIYHKGISFLPRMLEALYCRGEEAFTSIENVYMANLEGAYRSEPGNKDMINYFLRWVPKTTSYFARRVFFEELWTVRYKFGNEVPMTFDGFVTLTPPPRTWWGDPRAVKHGDDYYIFVEELHFPRGKNHGHIAVIKVDKEGRHQAPVNVLEMPYHLSYPFAFQWKDSYYMVLESSKVRTLEMYKATEFPYKWQHVKHLMTGLYVVDATLFWKDGLWWMFCNMKENKGAPPNDELFLFYSKDLFTEHWEPHPMNPIVSDVRNARPAGGVFEKDGILYRPSQDCSQCYGYAININRIEQMDEQHYKEVRVKYIHPQEFGNASRVHTFNYIPGFTVVDTYMARPKLFRTK